MLNARYWVVESQRLNLSQMRTPRLDVDSSGGVRCEDRSITLEVVVDEKEY